MRLILVLFATSFWGINFPVNAQVSATQLRGRNISTTAPLNGQVYSWDSTNRVWTPTSGGGGGGIADCGSNGVLVRIALNTTVCRTFTAGAGISITNGNGVSGNPVITSTITQGLTDCGANGFAVRTSLNTTTCRTLTAGSGISISDGDGVSGNPVITATGGGGGATTFNALTNWKPTLTSSTVLTFGACSSTEPCILAQGNNTANFTAPPTLTITGGTGTASIGADYTGTAPVLKAYLNGITATWASCTGCTTGAGSSVPDDSEHQPIAGWSAAVSTTWDSNGYTDYRAQVRKDIYKPGFGMGAFTVANGKITIPFDPTQMVTMCEYQFGDGTNAVASGETPGLRLCLNKTGRTVTILGASCWVDNASATTTVRPIKSGGATNSILSSTMSCSNTTPTGSTGTLNGTPTLADGEAIDFTNITPDTVTKQGVMRVWLTM